MSPGLLLLAAALAGGSIRWELCSDAKAAVGSIRVPAGELTLDRARAVAGEAMRLRPSASLVSVQMTEEVPAGDLRYESLPNLAISFESWLRLAGELQQKETRRARLIRIGSAAVLQYQSGPGAPVEEVVQGTENPLEIEGEGWTARILYLHTGACLPTGVLATTSSELTPALGVELARKLRAVTCVLTLRVRNDTWFMEPGLPVFYPYEVQGQLPTHEQYRNSHELWCQVVAGEASCSRKRSVW